LSGIMVELGDWLGGDPNTRDVCIVAERLRTMLPERLPNLSLTTDKGVRIVEIVEENFIKGELIRGLTETELLERAKRTGKIAMENLPMGLVEALAIALFVWHGCILMAKSTRPYDSARVIYTPEMRYGEYESIKSCWERQESAGNPWVKYGVSIAKQLEEKRKKLDPTKIIVDEWVPPGSPYWENSSKYLE